MRNRDAGDGELARQAAAGDQEAYGLLVERHGGTARRVALSILRDEHDADDAAQDGLVAAWRSLERFDTARPFRPWLMRIVVNAARDLARRRAVRQTELVSPDAPSTGASPEQVTERALLRARLRNALAMLPERQRLVVTLFDAEGFSHAEIAELVGAPEGTVRSELFHARRALREELGTLREEMQ
ncbi:MAG TPA: RNA polymerase sigma factor [Gemmatimonadales bacterium]|nr:RNA polymerase sigma factor [Gemmatimonadales bacterium]